MIDERKKPGVAFWATVVVVAALVAYPLTFGPACWLFDRKILPLTWIPATDCAFYPLRTAAPCSPENLIWRIFYRYADLANPNPGTVPVLMEVWIGVERD
jgi:hypothetical protein